MSDPWPRGFEGFRQTR